MVRRWAAWKSLQQAVVAASANNHITVLKLLWKAFNPAKYSALGAFSTVVEILNDASGNGHLRVVKLAVDAKYAKFVRRSGALAQAISGRRADVVEFLLGLGASWCDLVAAFVAASETSQDALAGRVYNVYREVQGGRFLWSWHAVVVGPMPLSICTATKTATPKWLIMRLSVLLSVALSPR